MYGGMTMIISNQIIISKNEPCYSKVLDYCKSELVVNNPEYSKKERMGFWVGNTPKKLLLYQLVSGNLVLPYGTLMDIMHIEKNIEIDARFTNAEKVDYGCNVPLYDYQEKAKDYMCKVGCGILQSPAGSGKTQIGISMIASLGKRALWLTTTKDLLLQSTKRAEQYMDKSLIGTITEGKVDIGTGVTFATIQTMCKLDLVLYKNVWDVIIVDECHSCSGSPTKVTRFSKVLNSLSARHKYGLSATVHRADGLIKTTYALLGKVRYIVPDEAVKDKVMAVNIERVDTNCEIPFSALDTDGTINYTKLISSLAMSTFRNDIIYDKLMKNSAHYNLILSDRLDQLHYLYSQLPPTLQEQAAVIDGKMTSKKAKAEREQAIEDTRTGKKHFLFASYKLAKEGLDIPRLDRLHLVTPQKDYAIIVQSVGRIARTFEGKEQPICFDYVDKFKMAENMYKTRYRHYRKCGCVLNG